MGGAKALNFVSEYNGIQDQIQHLVALMAFAWKMPKLGTWTVNFDGAKLGEWRHGWWMVVRDSAGAIVVVVVSQSVGVGSAKVEEAKACLSAVKYAQENGFARVAVKGNCLNI